MVQKIAIIGSGISGLTCALALKEEGFHVEVLETDNIKPASNAALGIVSQKGLYMAKNELFRLQLKGAKELIYSYYEKISRRHKFALPRLQGVFEPFADAPDFRNQRERSYHNKPSGVYGSEVFWRLKNRPPLIPDLWSSGCGFQALGLIHHPLDGWVCPRSLLLGLKELLKASGTSFVQAHISSLALGERSKDVQVKVNGQTLSSYQKVILCSGHASLALLKTLHSDAEVKIPTQKKMGEIFSFKSRGPNIALKKNRLSCVNFGGEAIVGPSLGLNVQNLNRFVADEFYLSRLRKSEDVFSRKGMRLLLKDRAPCVGVLPGTSGRVLCNFGYFKNGFYLAPQMATKIACYLKNPSLSFFDKVVSPSRFF